MLAFTNSLIGIGTIILFTYLLIYLWKRLLSKKQYLAFTVALIGISVLSVVVFFTAFTYLNPLIRAAFNRPPAPWTFNSKLSCSTDLVLFNCPVFGGAFLGIKLMKEWWIKQTESDRLSAAKTDAELQFLKSQVHPHFLFNTLNNIYSLAINRSEATPGMIKKLSGILRYIVNESDKTSVPVVKELEMINDYIQLEKIRYGNKIDLDIDCKGHLNGQRIAPLLLIPFVENSFKHGASRMLSKPFVSLQTELKDDKFILVLNNSKPASAANTVSGGIGLTNVKKRLELLYPSTHKLDIIEENEQFTVRLELQIMKHEMA